MSAGRKERERRMRTALAGLDLRARTLFAVARQGGKPASVALAWARADAERRARS